MNTIIINTKKTAKFSIEKYFLYIWKTKRNSNTGVTQFGTKIEKLLDILFGIAFRLQSLGLDNQKYNISKTHVKVFQPTIYEYFLMNTSYWCVFMHLLVCR